MLEIKFSVPRATPLPKVDNPGLGWKCPKLECLFRVLLASNLEHLASSAQTAGVPPEGSGPWRSAVVQTGSEEARGRCKGHTPCFLKHDSHCYLELTDTFGLDGWPASSKDPPVSVPTASSTSIVGASPSLTFYMNLLSLSEPVIKCPNKGNLGERIHFGLWF